MPENSNDNSEFIDIVSGKETTLEEDVVILDLVRGKGKRAKVGDIVTIYYKNQLSINANIVGSLQQGNGLKFKLGEMNESDGSMRGWHIGIVGMKKTGLRKIYCPPAVGFGERGLPFIPIDATLISEIHLLNIERQTLKAMTI